ncbi:mitochondrial DNA helicase [Brevipalpus obovatus]|uniref:mitochondrial DNA helicase n=1 Tax=Brevipalpus obovatus TaxID=246614 RepID=UPI003D9DC6FD
MSIMKNITSFQTLREAVKLELLNVGQLEGVKWKRFPGLNKYLKGHRSGELTILTGSTGCGKTTFLSEYSLDLCIQGLPTLWGNFEMKNSKLCRTMLNQFARQSLASHMQEFDKHADNFVNLPMYFMTYHGQEEFENVQKTMETAVQECKIKHVIIDNLQFMVGTRSKRFKFLDRYEYQDHVIGNCRKFATQNDCHVTLVIHPRKEDGDLLTMNSIFGGAKASQEADNILILQVEWKGNLRQRKYLQISKNRYDGDLGTISLRFNKESQGFGVTKSKGSHQTTQDVEECE